MPKKVSLEGSQFGKLKVIRRLSSSRDGSVLWECYCECGRRYEATTRHLNRKNNTVRSCGCNRFKAGEKHHQWSGHGDISGNWWLSHVKHSANCKSRKSISLTITKEYASDLFIAQGKRCAFTGVPLVIHNKCSLNTASLDRIDNTRGYDVGNVRWVHKAVNMMKRTMSDDYFIEWCRRVYEGSIGGLCPIK